MLIKIKFQKISDYYKSVHIMGGRTNYAAYILPSSLDCPYLPRFMHGHIWSNPAIPRTECWSAKPTNKFNLDCKGLWKLLCYCDDWIHIQGIYQRTKSQAFFSGSLNIFHRCFHRICSLDLVIWNPAHK